MLWSSSPGFDTARLLCNVSSAVSDSTQGSEIQTKMQFKENLLVIILCQDLYQVLSRGSGAPADPGRLGRPRPHPRGRGRAALWAGGGSGVTPGLPTALGRRV